MRNTTTLNIIRTMAIVLFVLLSQAGRSQMVYIPDTAFRNWVNVAAPGAMIGDSMNTNDAGVLGMTSAYVYGNNIHDPSGIEYFQNLTYLDFSNMNGLNVINTVPQNLVTLRIYSTSISQLNATLPNSLYTLFIQHSNLTSLPNLPANLVELGCANSSLTSLPPLPNTLIRMNASICLSLSNLPMLPASIETLNVGGCPISFIPSLPSSLKFLRVDGCQIGGLSNWPTSLEELHAANCNITNLPSIISQVKILDVAGNNINCLPSLPNSLEELIANGNPVTCLPNLPTSLTSSDIGFDLCNNLSLTSITTSSCFTNCDAEVTVNFNQGNYNYTWYTGQSGSVTNASSISIDSLCAISLGGVTITPTAGGCPSHLSFAIQAGTVSIGALTLTNPTCAGNDGSVTFVAAGGTGPYMFAVDGGALTASSVFNNLPSGNHTGQVQDINGCTDVIQFTLQPPSLAVNLGPDITTCFSFPVQICNTIPGTTTLWSNADTSACINVTTAGTYVVIVTDTNGCSGSDTINITYANPVNASYIIASNPECGVCNGEVWASGTGGNPPFNYLWTHLGSGMSYDTAMCENTPYTLIVTDSNGCVDSVTFSLTCGGNIWPGDANNDAVVDNFDVLAIGVGYGTSGQQRIAQSNYWRGWYCTDWADTLINGTNFKHVDCNGNGMINDADTIAIIQNFGLNHPLRLSNTAGPNDPTLFFNIVVDTASCGSTASFPLELGTAATPAVDIYGIAFTITYDTTLVKADSVSMDFTNCWIPGGSHYLSLAVNDPSNGRLYAAITRTDHTDTTGFGTIGTFGIVTVDNISARLSGIISDTLILGLSDVHLIMHTGEEKPLNIATDTLIINDYTAGVSTNAKNNNISVYPNPAGDYFIISSSENITGAEIHLYNAMNQEVPVNYKGDRKSLLVTTAGLRLGLYIVKIQSEEGTFTFKLNKR